MHPTKIEGRERLQGGLGVAATNRCGQLACASCRGGTNPSRQFSHQMILPNIANFASRGATRYANFHPGTHLRPFPTPIVHPYIATNESTKPDFRCNQTEMSALCTQTSKLGRMHLSDPPVQILIKVIILLGDLQNFLWNLKWLKIFSRSLYKYSVVYSLKYCSMVYILFISLLDTTCLILIESV